MSIFFFVHLDLHKLRLVQRATKVWHGTTTLHKKACSRGHKASLSHVLFEGDLTEVAFALTSPALLCDSNFAAGSREKSATKEAVALLSQYLGEHYFLSVYSCIHTCFLFTGFTIHNTCTA